MKPELSIIMPVYNSEETIQEAVSSILEQSYTNFEFIIVDDGCSDRTVPLINELKDPRIKLLTNERNVGLTRSLNKAIAVSTGQFIARQDGDDVSLPGRLDKQIAFLKSHHDVAVLGTGRATLSSEGKRISNILYPEEPNHADFLQRNCIPHGSIMTRREILDEVGGYNEDFIICEDYDLWLRISKTHRIMNLQEPLYGVRRHGNRTTVKKMAQSDLYRRLAVNLALGTVSTETLQDIRDNGIDAYYNHLNDQDKLKHHRSVKIRSVKYKNYKDAQYHLRQIIALRPQSIKARLELAWINATKHTS
jgi:glycosyltransferase involved in cell wall biosynthesis